MSCSIMQNTPRRRRGVFVYLLTFALTCRNDYRQRKQANCKAYWRNTRIGVIYRLIVGSIGGFNPDTAFFVGIGDADGIFLKGSY